MDQNRKNANLRLNYRHFPPTKEESASRKYGKRNNLEIILTIYTN